MIASVQWDWGYNGYKRPIAPGVGGVPSKAREGAAWRDQAEDSQRDPLRTLAHAEGPLEQGDTGKCLRVCAAGMEANGNAPGRDADGDGGLEKVAHPLLNSTVIASFP